MQMATTTNAVTDALLRHFQLGAYEQNQQQQSLMIDESNISNASELDQRAPDHDPNGNPPSGTLDPIPLIPTLPISTAIANGAYAQPPPAFGIVQPGEIYRAAHPQQAAELRFLAQLGLRTCLLLSPEGACFLL